MQVAAGEENPSHAQSEAFRWESAVQPVLLLWLQPAQSKDDARHTTDAILSF